MGSPVSSRSSVAVVANGTMASNAYGTMAADLHPFSIRHGYPCCACSSTSSSRSTGRPNDAENVLLQGCSLNSAVRSVLAVQQSLHIQRSVFRTWALEPDKNRPCENSFGVQLDSR